MAKRTKEEIAAEIAALRALKPVGRWALKTAETIKVQVEALEGEIDDTTDEFSELSDDQQSAAYDAISWMDGDTDTCPSQDWGDFCE